MRQPFSHRELEHLHPAAEDGAGGEWWTTAISIYDNVDDDDDDDDDEEEEDDDDVDDVDVDVDASTCKLFNINLQKPHPSGEGSGIELTPQENLGLSENS